MPQVNGLVGPVAVNQSLAPNSSPVLRQGNMGDLIMSELHGRFYEATYNQTLFSIGQTAALALVAANATVTGLGATAQPILGLWNPMGSGKNLVVEQLGLMSFINNVSSVAPGAFVWCVATLQAAISTGLTPWNRKTLTQTGSVAKAFAGATPLTGLVGNMTIMEAVEVPVASGLLTTTVAAATPTPAMADTINCDGSFIVPPGGVLALMCTLATTTHSVAGRLKWEEIWL